MLHNLELSNDQYNKVKQGDRHLFTKHKPIFSEGDSITLTLEGHREQLQYSIQRIDKAHIFANYCCLVLVNPMLAAKSTNDIPPTVG